MAVQLDGKIVAVGIQRDYGSNELNLALARYLPNGGLDPTFGTGGIVITDVSPSKPLHAMSRFNAMERFWSPEGASWCVTWGRAMKTLVRR